MTVLIAPYVAKLEYNTQKEKLAGGTVLRTLHRYKNGNNRVNETDIFSRNNKHELLIYTIIM
jgi:hypothetical protein